MTFARTSLLNALAVAIRLGSGLAVNKLLAIFIGPSGYAIIGFYQNFLSIAQSFSNAATTQGVTKLTAENFDNPKSRQKLWQTAGRVTLICSILVTILSIFLSRQLAINILHNEDLYYIFIIFGLSVTFSAFNLLILSILNGIKEYKIFVVSNIAGSIISLALTFTLVLAWNLPGALISFGASQSISLVTTVLFAKKQSLFRLRHLFGNVDRSSMVQLAGFMAMATTTALVSPLSQILARQWLIARFGLEMTGLWEAMIKLSSLQLLFFTTTLSIWYLPRISEIKDKREIQSTISYVLIRVSPIVIFISIFTWFFRQQIILILFERRFLPMQELFLYQMAGDSLKIVSWVYAFVMIGRGLTKRFIFCEIFFGVTFVASTVVLSSLFGFKGSSLAHLFSYTAYLILVYVIVRSYSNMRQAAI